MSSPSTKRKRTTASNLAQGDTIQPSSRDASGEELAPSGSSPASNTRQHKKHNTSMDSTADPPSKRARTRSSAANTLATTSHPNGSTTKVDVPTEVKDPGEPSSTTEDSMDIQEDKVHKRRASRTSSNTKGLGGIEAVDSRERDPGTEGSRTMKDPPKNLVHPKGYKTNIPPEGKQVRVYADGVFDLFHLGHMRQLEQAKTIFPNTYLIVGVTGDADTHRRKGLTVLSGKERAETIRHCKWVDEVIPNCPWVLTPQFIEEHNIDYIAHDDEPYGADEGDDIYAPIKAQGKFLVTQRTEGVSTTGIITKIVKDYEKYIARQLKRGTTRQELNVSWLKKNELDIKRHVAELRDSIKNNWTNAGEEIGRDLKIFWQNAGALSRPTSPAPQRGDTSGGYMNAGLGISGPKSPVIDQVKKLLDVPGSGASPGRSVNTRSDDFAAGYSLGLVGSIKSWMQRSRGPRDSQNPSPQDSEEDEAMRSPVDEAGETGRKSPILAALPSLRGKRSTRSLKSNASKRENDKWKSQ